MSSPEKLPNQEVFFQLLEMQFCKIFKSRIPCQERYIGTGGLGIGDGGHYTYLSS